jgi:hypothetical protein
MNRATPLNEQINLLRVGVAEVCQVDLLRRVCAVLQKLRHDMVLVKPTVRRAALQRLARQPHREMRRETGVTEVQLRRFRQTLQGVIRVWLKQKDDSHAFEQAQPRLGDGL